MATRTSYRWSEVPGSFDTVGARAVYASSNEHGIPDLPASAAVPDALVAYSDRRGCAAAGPGTAVHTFLDDYRFELLWTKPERPLPRLLSVGTALSPDFSLWTWMPRTVQLWQLYRSRWCGNWWLDHGLDVIPTVSWSVPESYAYAFAGIARGSTVALSTVGVLRSPDALGLFARGYEAMLDAVQPSAVLCYGTMPAALRDSRVREYPARRNRGA